MLLKANRALKLALGDDFFVTALVFTLNPQTLKATYASAGQAGPFLIRPGGKLRILPASGFPLGMFDNPEPFEVRSLKLREGDKILFFTDGVTESRDETGAHYGLKRLRAVLKRSSDLDTKELIEKVVLDVSDFLGDSVEADDMTFILMEVI